MAQPKILIIEDERPWSNRWPTGWSAKDTMS